MTISIYDPTGRNCTECHTLRDVVVVQIGALLIGLCPTHRSALLAALPPDPAPTGERRPCEAWVTLKDAPGYKLVEARLGGLRLAAWWSAILPMQQPVAWEVSDVQRVIAHDSAGDNIVTLEAAQLAAEDAAAELMSAGLRALGRGGK